MARGGRVQVSAQMRRRQAQVLAQMWQQERWRARHGPRADLAARAEPHRVQQDDREDRHAELPRVDELADQLLKQKNEHWGTLGDFGYSEVLTLLISSENKRTSTRPQVRAQSFFRTGALGNSGVLWVLRGAHIGEVVLEELRVLFVDDLRERVLLPLPLGSDAPLLPPTCSMERASMPW